MNRKISDFLLNITTYFAAFVSVVVLGAILIYLFFQGFSSINLDLIKGNYHASSSLARINDDYHASDFADYNGDGYYSNNYGIAFSDTLNSQHQAVIEVTYVDSKSPFANLISNEAQANNDLITLKEGEIITSLYYLDSDSNQVFLPQVRMSNAANLVNVLDNEASSVSQIAYQNQGGGIRGAIIVTLLLILISILIAMPIGIGAAIYLNEYAEKNKFNSLLRNGVETLTGVPSIIYGLMGITVLYPLTQLFGANSTSVLLGALTLTIILLPTIIRSTEEALIVVPQALRDGSLSLGATKTQTIFKVVLPSAVNGILTAVLLSIGRVIGESAALVYTTSTVINDFPSILGQGSSLSLMIWAIMGSEQPDLGLASAISLLILLIVITLNIIVKIISKRLTRAFI